MVANGHAFLGGLLFFLGAGCLSLSAAQTFSILHLHVVRAFLARLVAQCTARSNKKGDRAKEPDEHFHG
jgi:hypothetical protein